MSAAKPQLTRRQQLFVAAYLGVAKGNATEAATIAGYGSPRIRGAEAVANRNVRAAIEQDRAAIRQQGITVKQNRLDRLNERWEQLAQTVRDRAADPRARQFPGGETGLLVIEPQLVKVYEIDGEPTATDEGETLYSGKRERVVYVAKLDTGLLKEEREIAKQAAIEMGEWNEKRDTPPPAVNVNVYGEMKTVVLTYDQFGAEFARLAGLGVARPDGAAE